MDDWIVQIGPNVTGSSDGYLNNTSGTFYLELGPGAPDQIYAWYSTTAGSEWVEIPNNQLVSASGDNSLQWRFDAPAGVTFKFLMGPPQ